MLRGQQFGCIFRFLGRFLSEALREKFGRFPTAISAAFFVRSTPTLPEERCLSTYPSVLHWFCHSLVVKSINCDACSSFLQGGQCLNDIINHSNLQNHQWFRSCCAELAVRLSYVMHWFYSILNLLPFSHQVVPEVSLLYIHSSRDTRLRPE